MTLDELLARESIRQTLATYNIMGDRLRVEEFLTVFTEDAVLEFGGGRHEGREAIRGWMSGWGDRPRPAERTRQASFVRHHLTTSLIDVTGPETASGRTYFAVYTDVGPDHAGYYTDSFRKTGDRWLITHRRVRVDWHAPESLFRTGD